MKPLFSARPEMTKLAARTKMSSNPSSWGTEVLDAVYAELPFLRAYMLDVDVDRRDEGTGTGVGKVTIYPAMMSKEAAADAKKLITLPIIIRKAELSPFDTYTHDEALHPMDQDDVTSILHQADLFAAPVTAKEAKKELQGLNLFPPSSMGDSTGGGDMSQGRSAAISKTASAKADKVKWQSTPAQKAAAAAAITEKLRAAKRKGTLTPEGEKVLRQGYAGWGDDYSFLPGVHTKTAGLLGLVKTAATLADPGKPSTAMLMAGVGQVDVLQISGGPGNYHTKLASRSEYRPIERKVSDGTILRYGAEVARRIERDGYFTVVRGAQDLDLPEVEKVASAKVAGVYRVPVGSVMKEAIVFPVLHTLGGRALPHGLALLSEGYAEVEKVAGVFLREIPEVPAEAPTGRVVPVVWEAGKVTAYEPIEVTGTMSRGALGVQQISGRRLMTGEPITAYLEPGLRKVAHLEGHKWAFPAPQAGSTYRVAYLPYPEKRAYVVDPRYASVAEDLRQEQLVKISCDGSTFTLRGPGTELFEQGLDRAGASFALGVLGVSSESAERLLKVASVRRELVPVRTAYTPEAPSLAKVAAQGRVQVSATSIADLLDLIFNEDGLALAKTAGVDVGSETPSNLLALDFVTPENALLYVNFLSDLEKSASQLAELLIASRLGYDDIRESATKNAMTQVQSVIRDLQQLRDKVR